MAFATAAWPLAGFLAAVALWSLIADGLPARHATTEIATNLTRPVRSVSRLTWPGVDNIFVFGDSLSYSGFNPATAQPSDQNVFGNYDALYYPDNNQDGPKWTKHLATAYNQSTIKVFDLAVPMGYVERQAYEPRLQGLSPPSSKVTFREQVDVFQRNFVLPVDGLNWEAFERVANKAKTQWATDKTLFIAWFGLNDLAQAAVKKRLPVGPIFASYAASLERLYNLGARHFLLLNAPPTDRAPSTSTPTDPPTTSADVRAFNSELDSLIGRLSSRHADAEYFLMDVNSLWTDALASPLRFPATAQLKKLDSFCPAYAAAAPSIKAVASECGVPHDQYFWLNARHPTYPVHDLTASILTHDCFAASGPQGYCSLVDEYQS